MLYSLLLEKKKNKLKAYGVVEEISALRDRDSRWNLESALGCTEKYISGIFLHLSPFIVCLFHVT